LIIKNWVIIRKLRNFINLISDDSEIEMTDIKLMYHNIKNPAIKSHLLRNEIEKSDDETENDMDIITL
jgi:ribosomal protein L19E